MAFLLFACLCVCAGVRARACVCVCVCVFALIMFRDGSVLTKKSTWILWFYFGIVV